MMSAEPTPHDGLVAQLQSRLAAGDVSGATALLHAAHAGDVKRFVASRRPAASIRDICQDVWLAAANGLPRFRFETTPRAWLFVIASKRMAEAGRKHRRRQAEVELDSRRLLIDALTHGRQPPTSGYGRIWREQRARALHRILDAWRPEDRELIEMRFVAGLKPAEIVASLSLDEKINTVTQRIVRLAARLRRELSEDDVLGEDRRSGL
jgi:RNA polymerase sigma factor (sigma-70 family)